MGPPDGHVVAGATQAAQQHGLSHQVLSHADLKKRFPQFHLPDHFTGVFEPRAGFLVPEKVIAAQAELALRGGADLRGREGVLDWDASTSDVTVRTTKGEYRAKKLVFCGGPWSAKLVRDLGVELVVTRQTMGWYWPRRPAMFEYLRTFPVWGIEAADGSLSYGFPMLPGNPGLKAARHGRGTVTDPDHVSRDITPEDEAEVRAILDRHLPDAAGPLLSMRVCLYTNSPDGHFIIDKHPKRENVVIACGFSGHGFKFASVVGEVLADLAIEGKTALPAQFLARFGGE
jgi:sarcosine oxidase